MSQFTIQTLFCRKINDALEMCNREKLISPSFICTVLHYRLYSELVMYERNLKVKDKNFKLENLRHLLHQSDVVFHGNKTNYQRSGDREGSVTRVDFVITYRPMLISDILDSFSILLLLVMFQ